MTFFCNLNFFIIYTSFIFPYSMSLPFFFFLLFLQSGGVFSLHFCTPFSLFFILYANFFKSTFVWPYSVCFTVLFFLNSLVFKTQWRPSFIINSTSKINVHFFSLYNIFCINIIFLSMIKSSTKHCGFLITIVSGVNVTE